MNDETKTKRDNLLKTRYEKPTKIYHVCKECYTEQYHQIAKTVKTDNITNILIVDKKECAVHERRS